MRCFSKMLSAIACSAIISGCAIAPDIKDVSPLDPVAVVRHIECETQIALIETIASYLSENLPDGPDRSLLRSWQSEADPAKRLSRLNTLSIDSLYRIALTDPVAADYLMAWDGVVIGFGFTFDISVQNTTGSGLNFSFLTGVGTVKVDATASADKTRQNKKSFTVITSVPHLMQSGACLSRAAVTSKRGLAPESPLKFGPLAGKPDDTTITNIIRTQAGNHAFPITGSIGMKDSLTTFAGIWRGTSGGQARATSLPARKVYLSVYDSPLGNFAKEETPGGYTQVMTFTTKLSGKLSPTIELNSSNLTKATISNDTSRTDKHELILSFSAPTPAEVLASRSRLPDVRYASAVKIREQLYAIRAATRAAAFRTVASSIDSERKLLAFERLAVR